VKILLASDTYPPDINGAARFTEHLARGLALRGHDVHEVAPSWDGPAEIVEQNGVVVHRIRAHRYPSHQGFRMCLPWDAKIGVARIVRHLRPDVVHVQAHFLVGRYAAYAATAADIPLVATNHFMPENLVAQFPIGFPRWMVRAASALAWHDLACVYGRAQVVTAPTQRAVELLIEAAHLQGAIAVSCGVDVARYEDASRGFRSIDPPTILFVGRLEQEKRVGELIAAFAHLPPRIPAQLVIVGDGTMREEWMSQAHQQGVDARVRFRGFVSEEELLDAYGTCDVFCMPGVAELQSLATLEAMASGKPIIVADAMALPRHVEPGINGWLYHPGQIQELSARLLQVLLDAGLRRRLGHHSHEMARKHGLDATIDAFECIYEQVVGMGLRGGSGAHQT
jgi:phosphatidylinositol alpha 1,6-mannosyltransferase